MSVIRNGNFLFEEMNDLLHLGSFIYGFFDYKPQMILESTDM